MKNERSYSNRIYDFIDETTRLSFSQPLKIDVEREFSSTTTTNDRLALLLLTECSNSLSQPSTRHNYENQRIEENFDSLYARPRKRCVTLDDEPIIIPTKTMKIIQAERAQIVSTKLPVATVLSSNESKDEIDEFVARENERVERVKLRRRLNQTSTSRPPPAFNNPNYVDVKHFSDETESIFV